MKTAKLTKKHIFKCMLEGKPIELWLPTTKSTDPANIASHKLLLEAGVYVHHVVDLGQNLCLRVTYPIRVIWLRTERNYFSDDKILTIDGAEYIIRTLEINETIPLDDSLKLMKQFR